MNTADRATSEATGQTLTVDDESRSATRADAALSRGDVGKVLSECALRLGTVCESLHAQRLVNEVATCWPGPFDQMWWKWLVEAGRSLDLDLLVADVTDRDLRGLVEAGVAVVSWSSEAHSPVLLERGRNGGFVSPVSPTGKTDAASQPVLQDPKRLRRIVFGDPHAARTTHDSHEHERPTAQLWRLLRPELKDILAVVAISGVAGLLILSVPVTAQQLVRTVTFASVYQPILVLSLMLLSLLGFVAALTILQTYVAEIVQRRLIVRVAGVVSRQLPQTAHEAWKQRHVPELMNRFLDIAIVQKVVAALLVDGVAILLTTLIGMSVMAFYHPFLLGYDIALLAVLMWIVFGLGWGGVRTAVEESRAKYQILAWLEDVARCPSIFQAFGASGLAAQKSDALCSTYLQQRRAHFRVLLRQIVSIVILQALATTALLGLGGYLVLNEQLTLGQLVAAELIVGMIVASFTKLGKHIEGWYDLLAAVEKLSHLNELPVESRSGLAGLSRSGPAELEIRTGDSHEDRVVVPPGGVHVLERWDESQALSLRAALQGARSRKGVAVLIDGVELADFRPDIIRAHITVLCDLEFLPASIAENVHIHRAETTDKDVLDALAAVGLAEELRDADISVVDPMQPSGWPLTPSQCRRLVLARGLAGRPRVLVLDHLLDGLGDEHLTSIVPRLASLLESTTLLVITDQARVARMFEPVLVE